MDCNLPECLVPVLGDTLTGILEGVSLLAAAEVTELAWLWSLTEGVEVDAAPK